ncbi:hypothetical protein EYC84_006863 [Monilinia fructicola]|uniref:Alpha/beta hydrolase fold-3 domain-containing protein n=1 Tax=Monilinia fructicola TaxID=38448 RepID=A0A5M9K799_MONFR|nr:hypothetical protein EYC84_006863 [Monilinia fructicola]
MDSPKFAQFDISVVTFKTVQNHDIQTYILIPKNISPGPHPVIVKIHGGGSVAGSGIQPDWFRNLPPNPRRPKIRHNPRPQLQTPPRIQRARNDLRHQHLLVLAPQPLPPRLSPPHLTPSLTHTLLYGDSAGGHLAVLSSLTQPEGTIRACIAAYPQLDIESPYFNTASEKHPFGSPMLPADLLTSHLASLNPDPTKRTLISETPNSQERLPLILVALQQGRYKGTLRLRRTRLSLPRLGEEDPGGGKAKLTLFVDLSWGEGYATHTNHPPDNHHDNYSTVAPHVPREMNPSHPRDRNVLHALQAHLMGPVPEPKLKKQLGDARDWAVVL